MTSSGYAPIDNGKLLVLYGLICQQITHLKDGRPILEDKKLNCEDPDTINLLETEIAHFIKTCASEIDFKTSRMQPRKQGTLAATNYTTSVGSNLGVTWNSVVLNCTKRLLIS